MLVLAQEEARLLDHAFIGTEHILLGAHHEGRGVAAQALSARGANLDDLRDRVRRAVGSSGGASDRPPFTPRAKKVLELSLRESLRLGHQSIDTGHLLLGLIREGDGLAAQVLVSAGIDLNALRDDVLRLLGTEPALIGPDPQPPGPRCSFCGRPVGEGRHFVSAAGQSTICSDCIVEAGRALEGAGDEREVFLPVRVIGSPPDDEAVATIVAVVDAAFVSDGPLPERRAAVEDYEELQPFLALAARSAPVTAIEVARVRFVDASHAVVDFQSFAGSVGTFRTLEVASDGSRWFVTYDAMRRLIGDMGVGVPRRRPSGESGTE